MKKPLMDTSTPLAPSRMLTILGTMLWATSSSALDRLPEISEAMAPVAQTSNSPVSQLATAKPQAGNSPAEGVLLKQPLAYEPVDLNQIYYENIDLTVLSEEVQLQQQSEAPNAKVKQSQQQPLETNPLLVPEPFPIAGQQSVLVVIPNFILTK